MKKLMIGMFGALAMVAGAEVESGNIVGFEDRALTKGKKVIMGTPFVNVGQDSLNLQDIKIQEAIDPEAALIWWWDADNGSYNSKVGWVDEMYDKNNDDETIVDCDGNPIAGWADSDWYPIAKTFAPGESFWIQLGGYVNATITFCGEVVKIDSSCKYNGIHLTKGKKIQLSNPYPSSVALSDIKILESIDPEAALIWWWDAEKGSYNSKVGWVDEMYDKDNDDEVIVDGNGDPISGWADSDWYPVSKTFASGEAFWIQLGGYSDATIQFPNPFYDSTNAE